ncbi:MAG: HAD family phosphatase [Alphaproteobacteria bacterium]|nr:HAD family phosphatase [Alphaproteobacteria bacterium]
MAASSPAPRTVVFDIGNVLISWDPRNLYRKLFADDEARMEWFLAHVCTSDWNLEQDRGRSFEEAVALLSRQHPDLAPLISAFHERWQEMVPGAIDGSVEILEAILRIGRPTYAITNFNQDKFRETRARFPILDRFTGIVVSGDERVIKPEPAIYRLLLDRYGLAAADCVFIDDSPKNVAGARAVGMRALHFESPARLAADLRRLGLPI